VGLPRGRHRLVQRGWPWAIGQPALPCGWTCSQGCRAVSA